MKKMTEAEINNVKLQPKIMEAYGKNYPDAIEFGIILHNAKPVLGYKTKSGEWFPTTMRY